MKELPVDRVGLYAIGWGARLSVGLKISLLAVGSWANSGRAQQAVSFHKDVLPIISNNCFKCHGEALQMSKLDLRSSAAMLKGGEKGPAIVPGNAEASRLFRRVAGLEKPAMPIAPMASLTPDQISILKSWIDQGAQWDAEEKKVEATPASRESSPTLAAYGTYKERVFTEADRQWWAFKKSVRYAIPIVRDANWSKNPIDAFLMKAIEEKGLRHAPPADRRTLIRRAYLDLIGLLPDPDEVEAFVNDQSPLAWEDLIERLLASEHYGERWGRHWLDVARYADSSGYEQDFDMANAWRYRDYVIKAFNQDKPYNQFVVEQLAGDELDRVTYDSLTATSFAQVGPRVRWMEKDNPRYRYDYLDDLISTTFRGFMGLSANCARCHDHKFDPISRLDYYKTMAMFFGYVNYDHALTPPDKAADYEKNKAEVEAQIKPVNEQITQIEAAYKKILYEKKLATFPEDIQIAAKTLEEQRTPGQKLLAAQILTIEVGGIDGMIDDKDLSEQDREARMKLRANVKELEKRLPKPLPVAQGIRDGDYRFAPDGPGDEPAPGKGNRFDYGAKGMYIPAPNKPYEPPPVYFGANGVDPAEDQKAQVIPPGFLTVLMEGNAPTVHLPSDGRPTSGRRRALAEWIASENNPLTARVIVNRIWHHHFGRGIVSTPSNFGKMGTLPSHPELLDWLATEFVRQGWSIKQIHRLIMTSQSYRQMASDYYDASSQEKDPNNIYLWRFPLRRLESEIIRDITLSVSGQLNLQAGGPPFFFPIPDSLQRLAKTDLAKWETTQEGPETWRRSVYSYGKRKLTYPIFDVLDQPDTNVTCEKRNVTTVPTQALTLMNNEFFLMQARYFAERVRRMAGDDLAKQVKTAYRIALSREPTPVDLQDGITFLRQQREFHFTRKAGADMDLAPLADFTHVILNMNEFQYIK